MNAHSGPIKTAHFQYTVGYIIIIIKAIYNAQDPPKAANALSGSEKVWLSTDRTVIDLLVAAVR